jgi:hypothetical protein
VVLSDPRRGETWNVGVRGFGRGSGIGRDVPDGGEAGERPRWPADDIAVGKQKKRGSKCVFR